MPEDKVKELVQKQVEERLPELVTREVERILKDFSGDRYVFSKNLELRDGRNVQVGRTTGTKIGTATDQKLGFFGATPVDQPATVADASGCTGDADDRLNELIDRLQELGIIA